jgi:hypothetical protein
MAQLYLTFAFAITFAGIALFLGFLAFYRRKLARSRAALQELADRLHGRITRRSMLAGDVLEGLRGDTSFSCRYFLGSRNTPPNLTILTKTSSPAKLTIRREAWYDRFAKRIGLVAEIQTGDPSFDRDYFFDTDGADVFLPYLSEAARRRQIDSLFNLGFPVREITFGRKDLRIVLSPLKGEAIASVPVETYLDGLLNLPGGLPPAGASAAYGRSLFPGAPRPPLAHAGLVLLFCFLGLLILGGAVSLGIGLSQYEPLGNRLVLNTLALSAPVALLFLGLAFRWIRGRSSSHRIFIPVLLLSLVGFPLAFTGAAVMTNGSLDQGVETSRKVPVVDRSYVQNKNSRTYYVAFPSWQRPDRTDRLSVPVRFFREVRQGDIIVVRTRPGFWQEEWIAGIERVPAANRPEDSSHVSPVRFLGIRFYEGPTTNVPKDDRRFASEFARESARYIWCQVDMANDLWQDRDRLYTFGWQYLDPDGTLRGELSLPFTVRKEWQTAWVSHSWGWDAPGHWPPGTYRVIVLVDGRPWGEGAFSIR